MLYFLFTYSCNTILSHKLECRCQADATEYRDTYRTEETVYRNSKHILPEMKLRSLCPNSYIHVSVSDLYIPTIGLPILLQENRWTDGGNI